MNGIEAYNAIIGAPFKVTNCFVLRESFFFILAPEDPDDLAPEVPI